MTLRKTNSASPLVGDQSDWTTGGPHDGNECKKYRVVPCAHPSRTLLPCACFNISNCKKGVLEKGKLRKIWFSRAHVPLLLLPVAALWAFAFKCDARNGPLLHHTGFQNPAPLNPSKGPPQCGNLRENFRQNAEIVGNCVYHILEVKHCKIRGAENVGKCRKFGRQFSADPWSAECTADPPLHCTLLIPIPQKRNFCALWPIVTPAKALNQASLCRTLKEPLRTT